LFIKEKPDTPQLFESPVKNIPEKSAETSTPTSQPAAPTSQPDPPPPLNPYAEAVKSRKSAAAIEDDLFAGLNVAEPPKPEVSKTAAQANTLNSVLSTFGQQAKNPDANTPFSANTSYTKASQPFRLSQQSVRTALDVARKSEARKGSTSGVPGSESKIPQFGFMAASMRSRPTQNITPAPNVMQRFEEQPPEDVKRVSSSEWRSSSREQWSYDVDLKPEEDTEAKEAQQLVDKIPVEQSLSPEQLKAKKKGEISTLRRKAKSKKFIVDMNDLGVWTEEKTKVEALPDIKVEKNLFIPSSISVVNFADLLKVSLEMLQKKMELLGLEPEQCSYDYGISLLEDEADFSA
jgi:hypothetical protein